MFVILNFIMLAGTLLGIGFSVVRMLQTMKRIRIYPAGIRKEYNRKLLAMGVCVVIATFSALFSILLITDLTFYLPIIVAMFLAFASVHIYQTELYEKEEEEK